MSFIATLPMYDLPEVRDATSTLLTRITDELTRVGWPIEPRFADFADHAALVKHWRDPGVALSHSCGLPFLEDLADVTQILGTFQWRGVSNDLGRYRSVIVVRQDDARTIDQLSFAQPVINSPESLSGWCSLGAALHEVGYTKKDFPTPIASGSHRKSIEMVTAGVGDFAAIDGATFRLLERHRPHALGGVRAIGVGPQIPATPLITRAEPPIAIETIQRAIANAVSDSSMTATRTRLGIDRFVPLFADDYSSIAELVIEATAVLPRSNSKTS
jgi:ABC-type phosphate/phosphonate transport system substrate-binding protein